MVLQRTLARFVEILPRAASIERGSHADEDDRNEQRSCHERFAQRRGETTDAGGSGFDDSPQPVSREQRDDGLGVEQKVKSRKYPGNVRGGSVDRRA